MFVEYIQNNPTVVHVPEMHFHSSQGFHVKEFGKQPTTHVTELKISS